MKEKRNLSQTGALWESKSQIAGFTCQDTRYKGPVCQTARLHKNNNLSTLKFIPTRGHSLVQDNLCESGERFLAQRPFPETAKVPPHWRAAFSRQWMRYAELACNAYCFTPPPFSSLNVDSTVIRDLSSAFAVLCQPIAG